MSEAEIKELLVSATRQYCHNDGSPGFVFGYDEPETLKIFGELKKENKALQDSKAKSVETVLSLQKTIRKQADSRDELLEAVSQSEIVFRNLGHEDKAKIMTSVIKRAEALKEETK